MKKFLGSIFAISVAAFAVIFCYSDAGQEILVNLLQEAESTVQVLIDGEAPSLWAEDDTTAEVVSISENQYVYNTLSEDLQTCYDLLLNCMLNMDDSVQIPATEAAEVLLVYDSVMADYGGIFWVGGYSYTLTSKGKTVIYATIYPSYTMTELEKNEEQAAIDAEVDSWLSGISISDSDYEKVKYVYEIICENVTYDTESDNNQNILSVFINHRSVCKGYAEAMQYMLQELGVQSFLVSGYSQGEGHAWNVVRIDGNYYYCDVTWGDVEFDDNQQIEGYIDYSYLNVTTEQILKDHTIDVSYEVPECTHTEESYFIVEGLYYTEWNPDEIGQMLADAKMGIGNPVQIQFATEELYRQAISFFIEGKGMETYISGTYRYYYVNSDNSLCLVVWF